MFVELGCISTKIEFWVQYLYTQQKKLRKSQKNMQHNNTKKTIIQSVFICLDTCQRLRKMFILVC